MARGDGGGGGSLVRKVRGGRRDGAQSSKLIPQRSRRKLTFALGFALSATARISPCQTATAAAAFSGHLETHCMQQYWTRAM